MGVINERPQRIDAQVVQVAEHDASDQLAKHRGLAQAHGKMAGELGDHQDQREREDEAGDGVLVHASSIRFAGDDDKAGVRA